MYPRILTGKKIYYTKYSSITAFIRVILLPKCLYILYNKIVLGPNSGIHSSMVCPTMTNSFSKYNKKNKITICKMVALYSIIIILQLVRWWTWGDTDGSSVVAASTLSHTNPLAPLVPYCPLVPQCCCQRSQCVHTSRAVPPHTRSVFPSPAEQHMITHTQRVSLPTVLLSGEAGDCLQGDVDASHCCSSGRQLSTTSAILCWPLLLSTISDFRIIGKKKKII